MSAEALSSAQTPEPAVEQPARKKRHLAGITVGFLIPLLLLWMAWLKHIHSGQRLTFLFMCVPFVFVGFFVSCRSWRRWFHPDRLPVRWAEDSVWPKRLKVLDWVVSGMGGVVMLWFLVFMFSSEDWKGSSSAHYFWIVYSASTSFRVILRQYSEDRNPLPPLSSPRDLSQLLTDSIKPVYSKDWDNPPSVDVP